MIGKMVLDRNPDNFFAETEQVAFCRRIWCRASTFGRPPAAGAAVLGGRVTEEQQPPR